MGQSSWDELATKKTINEPPDAESGLFRGFKGLVAVPLTKLPTGQMLFKVTYPGTRPGLCTETPLTLGTTVAAALVRSLLCATVLFLALRRDATTSLTVDAVLSLTITNRPRTRAKLCS